MAISVFFRTFAPKFTDYNAKDSIYNDGTKYWMWINDGKVQSIYGYPAGFDQKAGIEWYLDHHDQYPEYPGEWISCVGRNERGHNVCQALGGVLWDQTGENNINKYYKISF